MSEAVRVFSAAHPDVEIELLQVRWWEQTAPLRDGRADVGYLRRPFDDTGLHTVAVATERKDACLPATHPLARRPALLLADLADESILDARERRTSSVEAKFELVAAGHGIALVPRSVARSYSRPDLVHIPVTDAEPVEVCIAVARDRRERHVRDFVAIARETLGEGAALRSGGANSP
ncbi:LysR family substrate-binding domain-containing protein [Streptomyces sp. NBC_01578]|uniref:LysR family substrate-binding domain-containing protein n=1 Tax=unclassified Streptomyces TaxID=2593676 RepID=UPI003863AACC